MNQSFKHYPEILTGNLTLSGAYWLKKDSGPLTLYKRSKLLYIVEKSAGQSAFLTSKHRTKSDIPLKFFIVNVINGRPDFFSLHSNFFF